MQFDGGEEFRQAMERSRQLQQETAALQQRMAELKGHGSGADGFVRMTVDAGGVISELRLDPRAMRMPSESLSEAIMAAHRAASQNLQEQIQEATAELLGDSVASLLRGETSPEELLGGVRATAERRIDDAIADVERIRRGLLG
jgi:DNA-binding protein YbaB